MAAILLSGCTESVHPQPPVRMFDGTQDGTQFEIRVPPRWNRTLLVYNQGGGGPGPTPVTSPVPEPLGQAFLSRGYAIASTGYRLSGFTPESGVTTDKHLIDLFSKAVGTPYRILSLGVSYGGLVASLLAESDPRVSGALSLCGPVAGGPVNFSSFMDAAFAADQLLGGGNSLDLVAMSSSSERSSRAQSNLDAATRLLNQASSTAAGRARLGLVAALAEIPPWYGRFEPTTSQPEPGAAVHAYFEGLIDSGWLFQGGPDLGQGSNGMPVGNAGVDYRVLLRASGRWPEIQSAYAASSLSLEGDLNTLNSGRRIHADPATSLAFAVQSSLYKAELRAPIVAIADDGDSRVSVANLTSFPLLAQENGWNSANDFLPLYVTWAGHCNFTEAEVLTGLDQLVNRLNVGHWGVHSPEVLNQYGKTMNTDGTFDGGGPPRSTSFGTPQCVCVFSRVTGQVNN